MIAVLGIRRVLILVCLLVLNGLLAAGLYLYVAPEKIKKERELRGLRGQVSTLIGDIDRMQVEFDQLEEQRAEFEVLAKDGFFKDQGRRQAEDVFNEIQKKSGVSKAIASIKAGVVEDNKEAAKAKHKILKSPIELRLEAVDDISVLHYLFLVDNYFPGHVAVEDIYLERTADVTGTVLRGIASGSNPPLVRADVKMMWRTMIPEERIINQEGAQ